MIELYYSQQIRDLARDTIKAVADKISPDTLNQIGTIQDMSFDTKHTDRGATLVVTLMRDTVCEDSMSVLRQKMESAMAMPVDVCLNKACG